MKKIIVILLLPAVLLPLALCGKTVRRTLGIIQSRVPESSVLAHETMELVYDYKYCVDTTGTLTDNYESDRMLLQISDGGLSKFSSYTNLTVDSLIPTLTSDQMLAAASDGKLSNGEFMTTFKNWPAATSPMSTKSATTGSAIRRKRRSSGGASPTAWKPSWAMNVARPNVISADAIGQCSMPRTFP